jgi:hypothetical protein
MYPQEYTIDAKVAREKLHWYYILLFGNRKAHGDTGG